MQSHRFGHRAAAPSGAAGAGVRERDLPVVSPVFAAEPRGGYDAGAQRDGVESAALAGAAGARVDDLSDDDLVDLIHSVLGRLRCRPLAGETDDEALRGSVAALARCESAVHAEKLRRLAAVDQRGAYRAVGQRSPADWYAAQCGATPAEARGLVRTAAALTRLPATAAALAAGVLTPGHAAAAARGLGEVDRQRLAAERDAGGDVEAWAAAAAEGQAAVAQLDELIAGAGGPAGPNAMAADADTDAAAADADADAEAGADAGAPAAAAASTAAGPREDRVELARRIDRFTASRDVEGLVGRERRALAKRGLWFGASRDRDGLWDVRGKLTDAAKAQLHAALDPLGKKTSVDDDRLPAQRRHDALATLARRACDNGVLPAHNGQRPHVMVIRRPADDPDGPGAWVDNVGDVSDATAQLFTCDAGTTTVTMDRKGRVFDVGRANGDPSSRQRQAVYARDRRCVGCGAPASRCQIHHIRYRSRGGKTIIVNLVLVCWACHTNIHHLGWTVQRDPDTGAYTVTRPADTHGGAAGHVDEPPPQRHP